jgi:glucokinase
MAKYFIGIDVGGSAIKAVITDSGFNVVTTGRITVEATGGFGRLAEKMVKLINDMLKKAGTGMEEVHGMGIGLPGLVDVDKGLSLDLKNLKWDNVDVAGYFSGCFNIPVFIDNDGNINALGEQYFGAGIGVADLIVITLGTGVGAGIIMGGELLRGVRNLAGEVGHMTIQKDGELCSCGNKGCFESYCSAKSMVNEARRILSNDNTSVLWELTNGNIANLTAEMLDRGYGLNDSVSVRVISGMIDYLSIGLASLIHIFNPAKIIIGGGVSGMIEKLLVPLRQSVERKLMNVDLQRCSIEIAQLGGDAGMMGACVLTARKLGLAIF